MFLWTAEKFGFISSVMTQELIFTRALRKGSCRGLNKLIQIIQSRYRLNKEMGRFC